MTDIETSFTNKFSYLGKIIPANNISLEVGIHETDRGMYKSNISKKTETQLNIIVYAS